MLPVLPVTAMNPLTKVVDGSVRLLCRVSTRASKKTGPSKLLVSEVVKHSEVSQKNTYAVVIPVVPGQAGGGSFQKKKNYIAQKEFAYRMRARRPTSAMPKSFLCCERAFCRSMVVMFCFEVKCFDVLVSVAGSGHVMVASFDAM